MCYNFNGEIMRLGVRNLIINSVPLILFYLEIIVLGLPKYSISLLMINFFLMIVSSLILERSSNKFSLVKEQTIIDVISIFISFFLISGIYIYLHGNGTFLSYSNSLIYLVLNFITIFNYLLRYSDNNSLFNIKKRESLILIVLVLIISFTVVYIPLLNKLFNTTILFFKEIITLLILSYFFICWYDIIKRGRRKKNEKEKKKQKN